MTSFSERYGYKKIRNAIQKESINDDLKTALWNVMYEFLILKTVLIFNPPSNCERFYEYLWRHFFNENVDEFNEKFFPLYLKDWIFKEADWNEIYDLLQFIAECLQDEKGRGRLFIISINDELKENMSAYRFVGTNIIEITDVEEIKEIETAINSPIDEVKEHLSKALHHISRDNFDYRNSIKESISAVECLCRKLTGESTLDRALKNIEAKGIKFNSQLKQGLEKIYHYTNGESGIRHSLMDMSEEPEQEDARFMLVTCSAFVNYLIEKAEKAGIKYE